MRLLSAILLVVTLAIPLTIEGCSLFQPAAPAPAPAPTVNVAQVVQKTISCMEASVVPCMTQPPPLNNPQLCLALAASACAAQN